MIMLLSIAAIVHVLAGCKTGLLTVDPMTHGDYGIDSITGTQVRLYWQTDWVTRGISVFAATTFRYQFSPSEIAIGQVADLAANESLYISNYGIINLGQAGQAVEYSGNGLYPSHDENVVNASTGDYPQGQTLVITGLKPDTWYFVDLQFILEQGVTSGMTGYKFLVFKTTI